MTSICNSCRCDNASEYSAVLDLALCAQHVWAVVSVALLLALGSADTRSRRIMPWAPLAACAACNLVMLVLPTLPVLPALLVMLVLPTPHVRPVLLAVQLHHLILPIHLNNHCHQLGLECTDGHR